MEFSFSEEQELLRATVEAMSADLLGPATARAVLAGEPKGAEAAWEAVVDAGWTGLLVPEEAGGAGATLVDACIVAEGLAAALGPIPYAGSAVVAAAGLVHLGGRAEDLAALAEGRRYAVVVGADLDWPPAGGPGIAWDWAPGAVALVRDGDGLAAVQRQAVEPLASADVLHPLGRLRDVPEGGPIPEAGRRFRAIAQVAAAAVATGNAAGAMAAAVEHAKNREQFGRAIGSFQAVQHLCADMLVDVESARSALYAAAWGVEHLDIEQATWTAAVAKAHCGRAAVRACETAVQVFGGMGITWECDAHLYLRGARLAAASFGSERNVIDDIAAGAIAVATAQGKGA